MGRLYNTQPINTNQPNIGGRLYQVPPIEPPKEGFLSKIGGFIKGRAEQAKERYGLGEKTITYEEGKPVLKEDVARKQIGFTLGVSPTGLKDVSAISQTVSGLKTAAQKQYTQALAPTKERFKQQAAKVIPGLIERKVVAATREGLHAKVGEKLATAGDDLEKALAEVPKNARVGLRGVITSLGKYKNQFTVVEGGKRTIIDEVAYTNVQKIQDLLKQFGDTISYESLRKTRMILDDIVTKGGRAFGRTLEEGSRVDATREAANAIRGELAKKFPNVAKVNAEYSFWKNVDEILEETIKRTRPHAEPLGEQVAEVAGGAAGFVSGAGKAVIGALTFKYIKKILTSTGYRTLSAVAKDRIADLIAQGKFGAANEIIRRIGITISTQSRQ